MEIDCLKIVELIIPLASAVIGGLITFLGVKKTIEYEKERNDKIRIDSDKPWIFNIKPKSGKTYREIILKSECTDYIKIDFNSMYIKNSDYGLWIISYLKTQNSIYKPFENGVIEKMKLLN